MFSLRIDWESNLCVSKATMFCVFALLQIKIYWITSVKDGEMWQQGWKELSCGGKSNRWPSAESQAANSDEAKDFAGLWHDHGSRAPQCHLARVN